MHRSNCGKVMPRQAMAMGKVIRAANIKADRGTRSLCSLECFLDQLAVSLQNAQTFSQGCQQIFPILVRYSIRA
jgi:hypothetical protein